MLGLSAMFPPRLPYVASATKPAAATSGTSAIISTGRADDHPERAGRSIGRELCHRRNVPGARRRAEAADVLLRLCCRPACGHLPQATAGPTPAADDRIAGAGASGGLGRPGPAFADLEVSLEALPGVERAPVDECPTGHGGDEEGGLAPRLPDLGLLAEDREVRRLLAAGEDFEATDVAAGDGANERVQRRSHAVSELCVGTEPDARVGEDDDERDLLRGLSRGRVRGRRGDEHGRQTDRGSERQTSHETLPSFPAGPEAARV